MKRSIVIFVLIFLSLKAVYADNYPRRSGIDVIHYDFKIGLSDSTDNIVCEASITVKFLKNNLTAFDLDLSGKTPNSLTGMTVSSVTENHKKTGFDQSPDNLFITLKSPPSKGSEEIFTIDYSGIPADGLIISRNKFGDRTYFGDNWPDRAHFWLPTIDHPYDKATCDFIVIAPDRYQVIANGRLVEKTDMKNGMRLTHWKETTPISTYLMVIGAARFAVRYLGDTDGIPVETWVYSQDRRKGFYDFSIAPAVIKYFSSLIGPFPFHKLANVESKTKFGGMENAGNIFYDENGVTGSRKNESTIAHEIAHQWFGDAVTEADWNHIWLSEGFATFFQNLFVEHQFGKDSLYNLLDYEKSLILNYYSYNPGESVVDTNINNPSMLLNPNSYQKGAWVLRMLRHRLGRKDFWKGIKDYYSEYRNKNVLTADFEKIMEKDSGTDLKWFFDQWIYKPGFPFVSGTWHYNKNARKLIFSFRQNKYRNPVFKIKTAVKIFYDNGQKSVIKDVLLDKNENTFEFTFRHKPDSIILDPDHNILMQSVLKED